MQPASGHVYRVDGARQAEEWLRELLHQAGRGELPGQQRTGVSFAEAAEEWLRYIEVDRERKPSMVQGYRWIVRGQLLPAFGDLASAVGGRMDGPDRLYVWAIRRF